MSLSDAPSACSSRHLAPLNGSRWQAVARPAPVAATTAYGAFGVDVTKDISGIANVRSVRSAVNSTCPHCASTPARNPGCKVASKHTSARRAPSKGVCGHVTLK